MVLVPETEEEEGNPGMARGQEQKHQGTRPILIRVILQESKGGGVGGVKDI